MPAGLRRPTGWEVLFLAAAVFCVLFVPALAILLGALGAMHGWYEGRYGWMAVCVAIAAGGLALELIRL